MSLRWMNVLIHIRWSETLYERYTMLTSPCRVFLLVCTLPHSRHNVRRSLSATTSIFQHTVIQTDGHTSTCTSAPTCAREPVTPLSCNAPPTDVLPEGVDDLEPGPCATAEGPQERGSLATEEMEEGGIMISLADTAENSSILSGSLNPRPSPPSHGPCALPCCLGQTVATGNNGAVRANFCNACKMHKPILQHC